MAYTTTEDDKHEIQANVNLVDFKIETLVDGTVIRTEQYDSLEDMTERGLKNLSFDDLVYKELFGDEFYDYNLVFCNANGRPLEHQIITRSLQKLIRENDLPPVVFHSLRHSSITYKLKLNGGDIKSVQGDSGHAQVKMVTDVYSHILDEDRRLNAQRFEETFYQQKNPSAVSGASVEPTPVTPPVQEPQAITEEAMLNYMVQNPEFLQKFKVLLGVGN